jgi:hypothetical protein
MTGLKGHRLANTLHLCYVQHNREQLTNSNSHSNLSSNPQPGPRESPHNGHSDLPSASLSINLPFCCRYCTRATLLYYAMHSTHANLPHQSTYFCPIMCTAECVRCTLIAYRIRNDMHEFVTAFVLRKGASPIRAPLRLLIM